MLIIKMTDKKLQVIDMDLIRELRRNRKYDEAETLIKAHQESVAKQREEIRKEILRQDSKIKRHIHRSNGLCYCGRERYGKRSKCLECIKSTKKSHEKTYVPIKRLCKLCKAEIERDNSKKHCLNCLEKRADEIKKNKVIRQKEYYYANRERLLKMYKERYQRKKQNER